MGVYSARDTGQYELPGTQTLAKCHCGFSTEIPHSSNLTPINFGNWHICFNEQQEEETTQNTVQFGTPPIKQPSRWTGATSSVVKNWISVSRGRSLDGNLVIFNQHCCQSMLCPRKDNLIYSRHKLVCINYPHGHGTRCPCQTDWSPLHCIHS